MRDSYAGTILVLILREFQTFLGKGNEDFELLDAVLLNIFGHIDALESSFLQFLDEGGGQDNFLGLSSDSVDVVLALLFVELLVVV